MLPNLANPWVILVAGAGLVVSFGAGWSVGRDLERVETMAAELADRAATIDRLREDAARSARVANAASEQAAAARARAAELQEQSRDLTEMFRREAASRPECACGFSDDDARQLRERLPLNRGAPAADPRARQ